MVNISEVALEFGTQLVQLKLGGVSLASGILMVMGSKRLEYMDKV